MSYIVTTRFVDVYNEVGLMNVRTHFPHLQITLPQLKSDRTSQFGTLHQATGEGYTRTIIEPEQSQSGWFCGIPSTIVNDGA